MNPLGGHIGGDGDGLGPKQPELFDIHVMIFAGDPESTVDGLARFFAIDRSAAARLVEDTPIVVKRAAEPDVAAEMLDVLGSLGAQVVLLPAASAVPSETDLLELKAPSIAPPPPAGESPGATWGALEPAAANERKPERVRAPRAATADLLAEAPVAELELSPSSSASQARSSAKSAATLLEARAPTRSAPPVKRGVIDDDLVIAPLYEPGEADARARKPVDVNSVSLPPALATEESWPPALGAPVSSVPPAPVVQTAPPSRASVPDLGLGSVPPLPALGAAPAGPPPVPGAAVRGAPPRVPPPSPRPGRPQPPPAPGVVPAAAQQRSHYERTLETEASLKLPSLGVVATGAQAAAAKPAGGDNYWAGRRAAAAGAAELGEVESSAPATKAANPGGGVAAGGAPGEALRDVPLRPIRVATSGDGETVRSRSAVRAGLEIGAGVLVFVYFMQANNSILLGNADIVSLIMHGLGIFGLGSGVLELRG